MKEPNKAPEPTTMAVTIRAPSSTARASHGRGSSLTLGNPAFSMPRDMKPTTPSEYRATLSEPRRTELKSLDAAIRKAVPKLKPYVAYSGTMIGYGLYHYKYASGREGDWPMTGFSPRKKDLTVYLMMGYQKHDEMMKKLGKHSGSKSCLYIKRLSDIHVPTLKKLIKTSLKELKAYTKAQSAKG